MFVCRWSFSYSRRLRVSDPLLSNIPVDELSFSQLDQPSALIQKIFVPLGHRNGFFPTAEVIPECLHRVELFLECHSIQLKHNRHENTLPLRHASAICLPSAIGDQKV